MGRPKGRRDSGPRRKGHLVRDAYSAGSRARKPIVEECQRRRAGQGRCRTCTRGVRWLYLYGGSWRCKQCHGLGDASRTRRHPERAHAVRDPEGWELHRASLKQTVQTQLVTLRIRAEAARIRATRIPD